MEKLNLDETWKKCLDMWKFVSKMYKKGDLVNEIKKRYLTDNSYTKSDFPIAECFFCNYYFDSKYLHCQASNEMDEHCPHCPGVVVDSTYNPNATIYLWCQQPKKAWNQNPKAFYRMLVRLNARRLKGTSK